MSKQRAEFSLDDDENDIDISELTGKTKIKKPANKTGVKKAAEQTGFVSRQPKKTRRRGKQSPYKDQLGIKVRPEMKVLFQEISDTFDIYDHTTFEYAILALLEKENMKELITQYKKITE